MYRKIEVKTWSDAKFRALSPIPPCAQGLWFYLLTGPHTGPIPGLFRAGRAAMAEDLGWSLEAFDKAFAEVFAKGMVKADFEARIVWLPNAFKHNKPASPNVILSWKDELDILPECGVKAEAVASMHAEARGMGVPYLIAFERIINIPAGTKSLPKASPKPFRKASTKTMPNQEQEQEQEQDKRKRGVDKPHRPTFQRPSVDEVSAYCRERGNQVDASRFVDFYEAKGWKIGKNSMSDWRAAVRTWERSELKKDATGSSVERWLAEQEEKERQHAST